MKEALQSSCGVLYVVPLWTFGEPSPMGFLRGFQSSSKVLQDTPYRSLLEKLF